MAHVDDLTFLNAAQLLDSDLLYVGRPSDGVDPDKRTDIEELISRIIGPDALGISPLYEQGTWTSALVASGTNPSSVTYIVNSGLFARFGNLVWVYTRLATSAVSGGSGQVRVGGLPYNGHNSGAQLLTIRTAGLPLSAGESPYAYVRPNEATISLGYMRSNHSALNFELSDWGNNGDAILTGVYRRP